MTLALALLLLGQSGPDLATLDSLAVKRDVQALDRYVEGPKGAISPFRIMQTGGAYEVGRFGWHALDLATVDGRKLVVFSTPLTSEDTGELVFERDGSLLRYLPEDDDLGVRVRHHAFDVRFDLSNKTATLTDEADFVKSAKAGKGFLIRMSPCYKVSRVSGASGDVPFTQAGGVVSLAAPPTADTFTYRFEYKGIVKLPNFAGSVSNKEATLTNDYWYPMIARQPASYSITLHGPKDWIAVAQGEQVSSEVSGLERTTKFQMEMPVTYFSASVAPYKTVTIEKSGRKLSVWSLHMAEDRMRDQAAFYGPVIETYDKWFGKYPFSGYGAVISDVYGAGALEAYSFATYGNVPGEDGHEPAHTWFGGILDNGYLHSFWNESFADYCDDLFRRHSPVGNESARTLAFVSTPQFQGDWDKAPVETAGAAHGGIAGSLGYGKGAYVLSMLEQELGTEQMIRCMRQWVTDRPTDRSAEWSDFEAAVAKVTGKDFGWFWGQWLRRPGVADFTIDGVSWADGELMASVHFTGPAYRMPVEILASYPGGREAFLKGRIEGNGTLSIPCLKKPLRVSFDPWRKLLRKIHADEAPTSIRRFAIKGVFREPAHPGYRKEFQRSVAELPSDLDGLVIVGSPATMPALRRLCEQIGLRVEGNTASYNGTSVDLSEGTATALVELGGGKRCMIAMGATRWSINFGGSSVCLSDALGRFLDGKTEPKRAGFLTFDVR